MPAGVELVDDDVRSRVARPGLLMRHALDDVEVDGQLRAGVDDELGSLLLAVRRRVHDERPWAVRRGPWNELAQVEARRDDVCLGHPARRIVGADDLGVRAFAEGELVARLAADVRSQIVKDALLPQRPQEWELNRLRDQRQPEVEVEDVGLRSESGECGELLRELHRQRPAAIERPVGLVVQLPALEDDEPCVDALAPQRLHVLPGDPRDVHGAVRDPQALWTNCFAHVDLGLTKGLVSQGQIRRAKPRARGYLWIRLFAFGRAWSDQGTGLECRLRRKGHWSNSSWSK